MIRNLRRVGTFAALLWFAGACAEEDEAFSVVGGNCVPGASVTCACPEGGTGVQICNDEGSGFGQCQDCSTPASGGAAGGAGQECTLFPMCDGCQGCWETCICQSGDVPGCTKTCNVSGSGGGSGGGGSCTVADCPDPSLPVGQKCCSPANKCGFEISLLGPGCQEANQPGKADPKCPDITLAQFTLKGCCKPSGKCGALDSFLGLGCVDPAQFGQPPGPSCTP